MRYKNLAGQIVSDIQSARLIAGQRMPSLRQLAEQSSVSMTTALNCYRLLEDQGWVVVRPKSGFYVSTPVTHGETPDSVHFRSRVTTMRTDKHWLDAASGFSGPFGISQLAPDLLPTTELQRCLKRAMHSLGDEFLQYADAQGVERLRGALSSHYALAGFPVATDELIIRNGCIDAVRVALEVTTKPGDGVAISSPCFNGLLELLAGLGRKVVEIPCLADGLDLKQLEQHLKRNEVDACLFSSSHMNPHGTCLSVAQKKALAELANGYRVPMIEDDIYSDLSYGSQAQLPVKYWDKGGYVLWCSSVSKTLAAGFRLGWCWPGRYQKAYLHRVQMESLACNSLLQHGLADFILSGQYLKHLKRVRAALFTRACDVRKLLLEHLPAGSAVSQPEGGMVLWVQVPTLNSNRLSDAAREHGLDIRHGPLFSSRGLYKDCFRVNASWMLSQSHDKERSIEQALIKLCELTNEMVTLNQNVDEFLPAKQATIA